MVERRKLEYKGQDQDNKDLDIEYLGEKDGEYYRLEGDEDLDITLERNENLTLAIIAAQGHEVNIFKPARALPNTAADELAEVLDVGNTDLNDKRLALKSEVAVLKRANAVFIIHLDRRQNCANAAENSDNLRQHTTL